MEITFTRVSQRRYSTLVGRDDKVTVRVPSHDCPAALPHDFAHYVVEQALGLQHGFWGSVAAGAMFGGMSVEAGRRRPHAGERSKAVIKRAGQRLIEAEVFVGLLLEIARRGAENDWVTVQGLVKDAWSLEKGGRDAVRRDEVVRVCEALREAERRWQALPVGGSVTVSWAPRQTSRVHRG